MSIKLTKESLSKLAALARLEIREEELSALEKDFDSILGYISVLEGADTSLLENGTLPVVEVPLVNNLRDDNLMPDQTFSREEVLTQFPKRREDYLSIKEVIEGGGR